MTSIIVFLAGFAAGYFWTAWLWPFLKKMWKELFSDRLP